MFHERGIFLNLVALCFEDGRTVRGRGGGFNGNTRLALSGGGHDGTNKAKFGLLIEASHASLPLHLTDIFL